MILLHEMDTKANTSHSTVLEKTKQLNPFDRFPTARCILFLRSVVCLCKTNTTLLKKDNVPNACARISKKNGKHFVEPC